MQSVLAAQKAILAILTVKTAEEETKRVALDTLKTLCNVSHTSISNCTFTG